MKPKILRNVRFTDLTWAGAGPLCTKMFSDFGADVIKVESSTRLDPVRAGGPFRDRKPGPNRSGYFASRNTGKKSVTINLKSDEGRQIVLDLVRNSDVVTNNFGPGAMDRLGLGYEAVRAVKSDIIYLSMPMYGDDGPRANMLGLGMTISAVTGLMWSTAYRKDDPVGPGTHYPDHAANCYHAAFAILAALRYRKRTGEGMKIDLSQVESTINFVGPAVVEYAMTHVEPAQLGNASERAAPHNIYRCKGKDEWCAIAVMEDDQWPAFATAIGQNQLAQDPELASAEGRVRRREELDRVTGEWTSTRTADAVVQEMLSQGIPAAVVENSRYLVENDIQLQERGYWQRVNHPELGKSLYTSPPFCVDGERVELERPPLLGEHTESILRDFLGMDGEEIRRLNEIGVLE
jgi:benzylsuccinate CoA-transferase BbsF subunit